MESVFVVVVVRRYIVASLGEVEGGKPHVHAPKEVKERDATESAEPKKSG